MIELTLEQKEALAKYGFVADPNEIRPVLASHVTVNLYSHYTNWSSAYLLIPPLEPKGTACTPWQLSRALSAAYDKNVKEAFGGPYRAVSAGDSGARISFDGALPEEEIVRTVLEIVQLAKTIMHGMFLYRKEEYTQMRDEIVATYKTLSAIKILIEAGSTSFSKEVKCYNPFD